MSNEFCFSDWVIQGSPDFDGRKIHVDIPLGYRTKEIEIKPESGQALKVYTAANYLLSDSGKKPEEEL
jgi:hypothetical protein